MSTRRTRRRFLAAAAGSAAGFTILSSAKSVRAAPANDRLRLAVFGTMYNAEHFLTAAHTHNAQIVAVCNADGRKLSGTIGRWTKQAENLAKSSNALQQQAAEGYRRLAGLQDVKTFEDVRQMFSELSGGIDALVVSDYDHFHGVACSAAMRQGVHVCSERPIGMNIQDARSLRALAEKTKVATTYRSPGTGTGEFRRAIELVEAGAIGPVKEVHVWFKRGGADRREPPQGGQPVPPGLNWDVWLGPLPERDYHPDWMAYSNWRESCNGGLGVFGMHTSIFHFVTLRLRELWEDDREQNQIRVTAECSGLNLLSFPRWERVRWDVPARGDLPPVAIHWHYGPEFAPGARELIHGKLRSFGINSEQEADDLMKTAGSILIGSDGALVGDDHTVRVTALPREKFQGIETKRPQRVTPSEGIYNDWIKACRGGVPQILANFDNGSKLSEFIMLGNIATQYPGQTITYAPKAGKIVTPIEANQKLGFKYRDGWTL